MDDNSTIGKSILLNQFGDKKTITDLFVRDKTAILQLRTLKENMFNHKGVPRLEAFIQNLRKFYQAGFFS